MTVKQFLAGKCSLHAYAERNISTDLFTPEVGNYLTDAYFKPGELYPWNEKIKKATGELLNPQYFIVQFMTST
jgi:Zn-dependent M32 family carboxypeptidase